MRVRSAEAALQDTKVVPLFVHDSAMKQRGDAKEVLIHLIRGIQNGLEATGYDMVLRSVPNGPSAELEEFISSRPPGPALVVEPSSAPNLWKDLRDRGWNTWSILDHIEDGNCVYIDQEHAGYLAARFLLNKGCRKIALLNGPLARYWGFKARLAGYKRALTEFKVPFNSALVMEGEHVVDSESGRSMLRSLIEADEAFDGVVGVSDGKTIGAMMAAEEAGLKVGEDVQFVSIDNTVAEFAPHPLSSVVLAFEEAGRLAASLATSSLFTAGPTPILTQCKLTPTVVER